MSAHASIVGLATATPEATISQDDAAALALRLRAVHERDGALLRRIYAGARIDRRASVALEGAGGPPFFRESGGSRDRGPTTAQRLDRYEADAPRLAVSACRDALADSGVRPAQITHLVTASCTGFASPGVDQRIIEELALPASTLRVNVGFMGCHAAINALRVADALCRAEPGAAALVCAVELCTLHFRYLPTPDQIVSNALFADGAGAAVVTRSGGGLPIRASAARLFPDSRDDMTWRIGDHGFEMTLSRRVPELLRERAAPWISSWLDSLSMRAREVGAWAIHPGGPRVVESVVEGLGLEPGAADTSLRVLRERGNVSSPTVLYILDELRRARSPAPICALAFGPGLAGEAMLLG